ncbi:DUF4190 domain-containing protein [Streptomyces sp. NPDC006529]|uniref:DUF4190 domain-containing protein n=1 Tax=Streptomyces sp. NPDC006529 TaxID=3157177 RepID=UPI0033B1A030
MTEHSPEPRDPWAPPERPAVDLGKQQGAPGGAAAPGTPGASGVHDQPTIVGMPGGEGTGRSSGTTPPQGFAPIPGAQAPGAPIPGAAPSAPAYGYPAQPAPPAAGAGAYGYPAQPDPAGYGYPGYPGHPSQGGYPGAYPGGYAAPRNGFGITALVLGILAVVGCVTSVFAIVLGILAVVFGVLGRQRAARGEANNAGMALAGLILGIVGVVLGGLMLAAIVVGGFMGENGKDRFGTDYDSPASVSQTPFGT